MVSHDMKDKRRRNGKNRSFLVQPVNNVPGAGTGWGWLSREEGDDECTCPCARVLYTKSRVQYSETVNGLQ